jgi:hypothetical protein
MNDLIDGVPQVARRLQSAAHGRKNCRDLVSDGIRENFAQFSLCLHT